MRITDDQMKKALARAKEGRKLDEPILPSEGFRESNGDVIRRLTKQIVDMPEREELVQELRRRIESGEYNPSGEEIADAMLRRAIADEFSL